jgi:hypothetical protein
MYHLVTFADSRMTRSLLRLSKQARTFQIFDSIHLLNEADLPLNFREAFKKKLILGSRGFGYWSWKPIVILHILNQMDDGDSLLYVDVGCHLNIMGKKRLIEYFEILEKTENGMLAFQADRPCPENSSLVYDGRRLFDQPNYEWIKGDLLDYFNVRNNQGVTHSQAIGSGIIFFRKCNDAINVLEEWCSITLNHFELIDDTPSMSENLPGFIEHRHDQALWTLLCLKYGVKTLSAYEYWYPHINDCGIFRPDWSSLDNYPIHAKRDKDFGKIQNIINNFNRASKGMATILKRLRK